MRWPVARRDRLEVFFRGALLWIFRVEAFLLETFLLETLRAGAFRAEALRAGALRGAGRADRFLRAAPRVEDGGLRSDKKGSTGEGDSVQEKQHLSNSVHGQAHRARCPKGQQVYWMQQIEERTGKKNAAQREGKRKAPAAARTGAFSATRQTRRLSVRGR